MDDLESRMNWLEIDRTIVNMMGIYTDRDKLFADVKQRFSWNDSQVIAAVEPFKGLLLLLGHRLLLFKGLML